MFQISTKIFFFWQTIKTWRCEKREQSFFNFYLWIAVLYINVSSNHFSRKLIPPTRLIVLNTEPRCILEIQIGSEVQHSQKKNQPFFQETYMYLEQEKWYK